MDDDDKGQLVKDVVQQWYEINWMFIDSMFCAF